MGAQMLDDPPEGYTAEEWASLRRAADVLNFASGQAHPQAVAPKRGPKRVIPSIALSQSPGEAYVVGCGEFVKLGFSMNVSVRLSELQAANPHKLELLATFSGGRAVEHHLHKRFHRYWHHYEWFRREGELAAWIEAGCPL